MIIGTNKNEGSFLLYLLGLEDSETAIDTLLSSLPPTDPGISKALTAVVAEAVTDLLFIYFTAQRLEKVHRREMYLGSRRQLHWLKQTSMGEIEDHLNYLTGFR